MGWWSGKKGKFKEVSTLTKEQQPLQSELVGAGQGAFGAAADFWKNLLSNAPEDMEAFAAPELRRFREETIPGLSEQFAGMGAGGLSSSGFRNAAVGAGTDLAERLGAIRANLRQNAAQSLMNLGQAGLTPVKENIYMPGTEGFGATVAPAVGTAIGAAVGGPLGAGIGGGIGSMFGSASKKGQSSPYGMGTNAALAGGIRR